MAVVHFYCVTVLAVYLCVLLLLMDIWILFENYMDNSLHSYMSLYAHVHHFYLVCT